MLQPAPKFSAGLRLLGLHEFLSPTPARCPDGPARFVPAVAGIRVCSSFSFMFIFQWILYDWIEKKPNKKLFLFYIMITDKQGTEDEHSK